MRNLLSVFFLITYPAVWFSHCSETKLIIDNAKLFIVLLENTTIAYRIYYYYLVSLCSPVHVPCPGWRNYSWLSQQFLFVEINSVFLRYLDETKLTPKYTASHILFLYPVWAGNHHVNWVPSMQLHRLSLIFMRKKQIFIIILFLY